MKRVLAAFAVAAIVVAFGVVFAGDKPAEDKKVEKKGVGALPPNPLDVAFEKVTNVKELNEALLNDPTYKKAVLAALKAKKDAEDTIKKNPNIVGVSPAQAARRAFLAILAGEKE